MNAAPAHAANNTIDLSLLDNLATHAPMSQLLDSAADPFTDNFPAADLDALDPSLMQWPLLDMESDAAHSAVTDSTASRDVDEPVLKVESSLVHASPPPPPLALSASVAAPPAKRAKAETAHSTEVVRATSTESENKSVNTRAAPQPAPARAAPMSPTEKAKEKLAQRKLRNKESARRYREKQVARRRQLEDFTRSLAEQNRELEALHDRLLALTCERRLRTSAQSHFAPHAGVNVPHAAPPPPLPLQ